MKAEVLDLCSKVLLGVFLLIVKCERCGQAGKAFCLAALNGTDLGEQNKSTVCSHIETAGPLHIWHIGSMGSTFSHAHTQKHTLTFIQYTRGVICYSVL